MCCEQKNDNQQCLLEKRNNMMKLEEISDF